MPISEAQKRATAKYQKEHYKYLTLRLKPEEKDLVKKCAESLGKTPNKFIKDAVLESADKVMKDKANHLEE